MILYQTSRVFSSLLLYPIPLAEVKVSEVDCRKFRRLCVCCMLSYFNHVCLFAPLWIIAHWAPLSMGFSKQEYCNGLPCPPPGDLPDPGIESESLKFPALAGRFFTTSVTEEAPRRPWTFFGI